jgi:hypothetical protein
LVTVTVAAQVLLLVFTSVTVKVTLLTPKSSQVKVFGFKVVVAMPQASLLPLSMLDARTVWLPLLAKLIVTFWQSATGATLSCTVTLAEQVLLLPLTSVTVSTTVFGPATLAQVKLLLFSVVVAIPQASLLPLLTAEAVVLPLPALFSWTVTGWQSAIGAMLS